MKKSVEIIPELSYLYSAGFYFVHDEMVKVERNSNFWCHLSRCQLQPV